MRMDLVRSGFLALAVTACGSSPLVSGVASIDSREPLRASTQDNGGSGGGLDLATAQAIVRTACDQTATVASLTAVGSFYEAAWGVTQVQWPDRTLHPAPAKWAHLVRANPEAGTTTCGLYEY